MLAPTAVNCNKSEIGLLHLKDSAKAAMLVLTRNDCHYFPFWHKLEKKANTKKTTEL